MENKEMFFDYEAAKERYFELKEKGIDVVAYKTSIGIMLEW